MSTRRCYIQNIKALGYPVLEKKNYKIFILCSYVQLLSPRAGPVLTLGDHLNKLDRGSLGPNIKALCHLVSEKNIFKDFAVFSLLVAMATRVMDGIKFFELFL